MMPSRATASPGRAPAVATRGVDRLGDAVHHAAVGEEREGAPARGVDERGELVDDRGLGAVGVARSGKCAGHVEQRVVAVVEGAGDALDADAVEAEASCGSVSGIVALVSDRGDAAPTGRRAAAAPTSTREQLERRPRGRAARGRAARRRARGRQRARSWRRWIAGPERARSAAPRRRRPPAVSARSASTRATTSSPARASARGRPSSSSPVSSLRVVLGLEQRRGEAVRGADAGRRSARAGPRAEQGCARRWRAPRSRVGRRARCRAATRRCRGPRGPRRRPRTRGRAAASSPTRGARA